MRKRPLRYFVIMQKVSSGVRAAGLVPGMRIPSENEIIERYRVSNTTLQGIWC